MVYSNEPTGPTVKDLINIGFGSSILCLLTGIGSAEIGGGKLQGVRVKEQGHWPVIYRRHLHICSELAVLHLEAAAAAGV